MASVFFVQTKKAGQNRRGSSEGRWHARYKAYSPEMDTWSWQKTRTEYNRQTKDHQALALGHALKCEAEQKKLFDEAEEARKLGRALPRKQDEMRSRTLGQMMEHWLKHWDVNKKTGGVAAGHKRNVYSVRKHFLLKPIAGRPLRALGSSEITAHLESLGVAAATYNNVRRFVLDAAKKARRHWGITLDWDIPTKATPKGMRQTPLRSDEIPLVIGAIEPKWQSLFAITLYQGLRKGEAFALRKNDLNLTAKPLFNGGHEIPPMSMRVGRSHDREVTKNGRTDDVIPIHPQAIFFLERAIESSPSDLVFPGQDGGPLRADFKLARKLHVAMIKAGLIDHYEYKHQPCAFVVSLVEHREVRCTKCGRKCIAVPCARPVRFHDLRSTLATILVDQGVPMETASKILRHSSIAITAAFYARRRDHRVIAEQFATLDLGLGVDRRVQNLSKVDRTEKPKVAK